ncbi:MAG: gamma-glutamyl-gamma-aminobutyrate hydrolase family protein [Bacilli bacterium]|nr:gamma-glutamyl-gamma-aminobutyrate hydrolase family protein [Bacilli bacterium]
MKKPIIGMICPRNIDINSPFKNYTKFVNTYGKRIMEAGGIPIGIIFPDGFKEEQVEMCDGFLFQGGSIIESSQISTIHYAIIKDKPIFGICLGMQTMAGYNWLYKKLNGNLTYQKIEKNFKPEDEEYFLKKKEGHDKLNPFYLSKIESSKHCVIFDKESNLYKIYGENSYFPSIHNFIVKEDIFNNSHLFKVTGKSPDGVIEAIEGIKSDNFIVGVQFHPELEDKDLPIFKTFIKKCQK